jgi:hypothetical protein
MNISSPLDSASAWLTSSNIVYVAGAVLTFAAAVHVLWEKRAVLAGRRPKESFWAEASVVLAAVVSVLGTIGAIHFGNTVSHLKDVAREEFKTNAETQIAQANKEAANANSAAGVANQKAEETRLKAESIGKENSTLRIDLATHKTQEHEAETKLNAQNKELAQFTQGLAQQQQGMAKQMQAAPSLNEAQVNIITAALKPFAAKSISIHVMMDARSQRLAAQFQQAFVKAGIKIEGSSTDVGPNYVGVMVVVKNPSPQPHPPLADALISAIQSVGIQPHPAADPSISNTDEVRLCIGPE